MIKEMFKAADTDGDGGISLDEFKTIMRAGPDTKPDNALVGGIKGGIGGATNLVGGAVGGAADLAKKGTCGEVRWDGCGKPMATVRAKATGAARAHLTLSCASRVGHCRKRTDRRRNSHMR